MTPEKLGIVVAAQFRHDPQVDEEAKTLALGVCDKLIPEIATKLRLKAMEQLGISFDIEKAEVTGEKYYDFAMAFDGDMSRYLRDRVRDYIESY